MMNFCKEGQSQKKALSFFCGIRKNLSEYRISIDKTLIW